ncbi:hypothetical protein P154DRAFT_424640, partial [Amniculicola lignicola CBS 123094]
QECVEQISKRYPETYVTDNNDDEKLWLFNNGDAPVAHIVLICTKPQSTSDVCDSIRMAHDKASFPSRNLPMVVTMCPGITISKLETWLHLRENQNAFTVVKTMPNTPVYIRQGATAFFTNKHASEAKVKSVVALFRVFSPCVERLAEESLLDVAVAVSDSRPAYVFQLYKSLVNSGVECGLPEALAHALVTQTSSFTSSCRHRKDNEYQIFNKLIIKSSCYRLG